MIVEQRTVKSFRALDIFFNRSDTLFFKEHPRREARIRIPYIDECFHEFASLGEHDRKRRRLIIWKVPDDNPMRGTGDRRLLKIPFLAFSDETIEDSDEVLLPILKQIMAEAYQREKMRTQ